jgi:hypothetical protein
MTFKVAETPWVAVKKNDPSFVLEGPFSIATRAGLEFSKECPRDIMNTVSWAIQQGWIDIVAHVPKDDPTLIWETLKK